MCKYKYCVLVSVAVHGSNNTSGGVLDDVRISKTTLYVAGGAVAVLVALCVLGWALLLCISAIYYRSTRYAYACTDL